jgi:hypothetical protein
MSENTQMKNLKECCVTLLLANMSFKDKLNEQKKSLWTWFRDGSKYSRKELIIN